MMRTMVKYARINPEIEERLRRNIHDHGLTAVGKWLDVNIKSILSAMAGVATQATVGFVEARWREKGPLTSSPLRPATSRGPDETAHYRCEVP
jgi:hypothetical protein